MGWLEFLSWLEVHKGAVDERNRAQTTDPETWDNRENDGWWREQDEKREKLRGRRG